jgi:MFS-type transporter involved in bile tolerance (Atg22 family)
MEVEMKKRFGVLRVVSTVLKIVGVALAVVAILGGLIGAVVSMTSSDLFTDWGFDENTGALFGMFISFVALVGGLLGALLTYGFGELIILLIAIEENTGNTAKMLVDITEEEEKKEEKKETKK